MIRNALIAASIAVSLFILVRIVRRFLRRKAVSRLFQPARCIDCGWSGQVSRYAGRCPQCNRPLGEQKAQRRPEP
jgi:predicted Zn-ribbon and HTH transcriptional regulator